MSNASAPPKPAQSDRLSGVVSILTYRNSENGYFVARVEVDGKEKTVTGFTPDINLGEVISAKGKWVSSKWGPQFKADAVTMSAPRTNGGVVKYLSHAIDGIGKAFAQKLVDIHGEKIFDIIENDPSQLMGIKGIGKKKVEALVNGYAEKKGMREIEVFLFKLGLSPARAKRVFAKYGSKSVEKLKANPYLLCQDIWGIGFKTADDAARKQGIPRDSEFRIRAAIFHLLREAEDSGSCGTPVDKLMESASSLLGLDYLPILAVLENELEAGEVVKASTRSNREGGELVPCYFSSRVYNTERAIARRLLAHSARVVAKPVADPDLATFEVELDLNLMLETVQRDAVRTALLSQVCVITGGPGTGKTTITKVILKCLEEAGLKQLLLCAPTGKAAKRAEESTGYGAATVHRVLGVQRDGSFKFNENNPLDADVVVMDESSMTDIYVFLAVLKALPAHARLLIIGDVDQLPSVGSGKVLADIIDSGAFPTVRLTQVFRQAADSDIILNAHRINRGEMPERRNGLDSDFHFVEFNPKNPDSEEDKEEARQAIFKEIIRLARDMYKRGFDPIRDVQVLSPMRRGSVGTAALCKALQAALNPNPSAALEYGDTKWGVGDKVMQIRNNYDRGALNGDIGYIVAVDPVAKLVEVKFDTLTSVYKVADLDEVVLAYAFTTHKSQGSEFPVVIMPVELGHFVMLRRNLVYTGVTRAKKLFVGVGQRKALQIAVAHGQNEDRWTLLRYWLAEALPQELEYDVTA